MSRLRTLIVDDSVVFRSFMRRCLGSLDNVDVVGVAANGELALSQVRVHKPDLITLDMEMPRKGGLELLRDLREVAPETRVIIVSSESETDADRTIEALELGASEFILKPEAGDDAEARLLQRLRAAIDAARSINRVLAGKERVKALRSRTLINSRFKPASVFRPDIVAIGASTGGPAALTAVVKRLPAEFGAPVLIVQHMPPLFVKSLAARLDRESALSCLVAEDGMELKAGQILLAPGDIHCEVIRNGSGMKIRLVDGPKMHHCRPAVDWTFGSLKFLAPSIRTLAVVLTGMGSDGAAGAKAIAESGGYVIAQDEETSTVWGMPGATVRLGAANRVLPLDAIAAELIGIDTGEIRCAAK